MRLLSLLALVVLVTLVITTTDAEAKKGRKKKGCLLNNKYFSPGKIAYRDKTHCLKLKCFKVRNFRGKVKYLLKPRSYRNCQCFPILCKGKRCSPPQPCPICTEIWEPVCGANNKTYPNECQMWSRMKPCGPDDTDLLHYGECGRCPTGCPKILEPVCGSDGNTYNNECLLQTAACDTNTSIIVVKEGECNGSSDSIDDPIVIQPSKRSVRKSQCKYNGKRYNSGEMITDLIDYCLTIACQPTRRARGNKIVFQDFQGANACDCSRDKLRKQIMRLSRL